MCTPNVVDELLQQETSAYVDLVMDHLPATEQRHHEIKQCQESDEACQQIAEFCQSGWPEKTSLTAAVKPYFPLSAEFSVYDGLLLRGGHIVIPPPLRKELLNRIHSGHQGITKCRERARQSIWWPGLAKELGELVRNCRECLIAQKQ